VAQESMQMTIKGQQESAMIAEQAKQQTIQVELQSQLAKIEAEKQKEIEVMNLKYELENRNKVTEIREKGSEDMNQLLVEIEGEKQTGTNIRNDKT
jgi:thiamine pyrophosphokinase